MNGQISLDPLETLAKAILDRTPAQQRWLEERGSYSELATQEARVLAKSLLEDGIVEMGRE